MGSELRSHWLSEPSGSVGRAEALGRLCAVLDRADRGQGHLALVRGGPAAGKTTLLHDLGDAARARGAVVLTASAAVEESTLDWSLTDQLFCGTDLPREVRDAAATVLSPGAGHPLDRAVAVNDLCTVLLDLARHRPVLVCVDDVHWSDTASLQFLTGLHRRLPAAPMTVVLTEWTRRWPAMLSFSAELARRPVERLALARLSVDDVRSMAAAALGESGCGQFVFEVHQLSGGNARLAQAMIEDCAAPGHANGPSSDGRHVVIGPATRQAVLDCVQGWDPLLAYVARALAVLGTPAEVPLVASMVKAAADEVDDAMEVLVEAGLIVGGRFRHAGMRQAVAASLSREDRRAVHLRAARLLPPLGAAAVEVAPHLIAAGHAPDGTAVQLLRDAADQALDSDRLRLAVECLELARRDTPTGPVRTATTRTLVRALWRLDPAAARQYLPDLRDDLARGSASSWHDEVAAVRAGLWWGEYQNLADIPGAAAVLDHPRGAVELHLSQLLIRGSAEPARTALPGHPDAADPWGPVLEHLAEAATTGVTEATVVNAEQVLESCDLRDDTIGIVWWCLTVLLQGGRVARATRWNEAFIAEAARRGAVTWGAVLTATRADIALRLGDAETAASCAAAAMDLLPQPAMGLLAWYSGATFVMASSRLKRFDEAERTLLALAEPGDGTQSLHRLRFLQARGQHLLATSRPRAALDQFEEVGRRAVRHGLDVPSMLPWRVDLAQAQMRLGQGRAAQETLIRHLRHLSSAHDPRSRGQALRLLAAMRERPTQVADLLTRAVKWLERAGDRYELSLAHADLRELERRAGLVPARNGTGPGTVQGAGTLEDRPVHDPATVLSRSEHRVVALAAQGRSNREIAASLFITVSTVEQHLTKAYRKLAVGSRSELAGMLASAEPRSRGETSRGATGEEFTRHESARHEFVRRDGRAGGLAPAT